MKIEEAKRILKEEEKRKKYLANLRRAQKHRKLAQYYNVNSAFGNTWAMFYCIIGGRKTGKSYSVTRFLCNQKRKKGDGCKNYWMRISDTSIKAMLANKASKLVDPDLQQEFKLELTTKGMEVFNRGKPFMTCVPLSAFAKLKGVAFYDKNYKGEYNIVLDEFQLEQGERRTSFDILYNFIGMIENIARTTKNKIRIILSGNTLEEASTIMKAFNFLPERFGRFYLKRKKCLIDNIEPTEEYLKDREGTAQSILGGDDMSNYTNELKKDLSLIDKSRLITPRILIKFGKERKNQYLVWDNNKITRYKGQPVKVVYSMRPYLDSVYSPDRKQTIIDIFDAKGFKFDSLITLSYFQAEMQQIRK